jgi:hypothetical protein
VLDHRFMTCFGHSMLSLSVLDCMFKTCLNHSTLSLSVLDRRFKTCLGHSKDYEIDIYCFSTKNTSLKSKDKD